MAPCTSTAINGRVESTTRNTRVVFLDDLLQFPSLPSFGLYWLRLVTTLSSIISGGALFGRHSYAFSIVLCSLVIVKRNLAIVDCSLAIVECTLAIVKCNLAAIECKFQDTCGFGWCRL